MTDKIDRWVYKSKIEQTVVVRPTTVCGVYNSAGTMIPGSGSKLMPIKLKFENCHCFVDADFAKRNKIPLEDLILLIESEAKYGTNFWCIHKPGKPAPKLVEQAIEDSGKKKVKVIRGVRK